MAGASVGSRYVVRRRAPSIKTRARFLIFGRRRVPYRQPWELLRDGRPVGFYETELEAFAASPEPPEVEDARDH